MLTDEQKSTIIRLKEKSNFPWKQIVTAVEANVHTVRGFYQKNLNLHQLPPKDVLPRNSKIAGAIGLQIKKTLNG
jgi:hypothetical protein